MFEEDYERCFICQAPCKGLYCSSLCRVQDQGTPSPAVKPATPAVKLTSQLPVSLSPMLRPAHHHISTSPQLPPSNGDSSSSSSITSSPIQSPRTNSSATDSPRKESFHLPPLAYPKESTMPSSFAFAGSMPVKIPNLVPRNNAEKHTPSTHTPVSNGNVYPFGTSIDTLRFGRKPGSTNSVVSPNALGPSCHCGRPYNHKHRATSKDRGLEAGLTHLVLGPSVLSHDPHRSHRIVSESAASPGKPLLLNHLPQAATGYNTPAELDARGASFLSRSRSDPIPSPEAMRRAHGGGPIPNRAPASRRASNLGGDRRTVFSPTMKPVFDLSGTVPPASLAQSPRRGRSRERQAHPVDREISTGGFNLPPDREHPPSRSRHRRDERRRSPESRERQRTPASAFAPLPEAPSETSPENRIVPPWLRRASPELGPGEGIAPGHGVSATGRSPVVRPDGRQEELRRAEEQLSQVFGIAAG